jgi:type VI secretion system secreted protein Hcp
VSLEANLKLAGQVQGPIKGDVTAMGHEGTIRVTAANHVVNTPRDPATGAASGKRQHAVLTVVKNVDVSSPHLYAAWAKNEALTTWELQMFQPDPAGTGTTRQYYTVRLSNAAIARIQFELPSSQDPALKVIPARETVSFAYGKIEWIWTTGPVAASDTWAGP